MIKFVKLHNGKMHKIAAQIFNILTNKKCLTLPVGRGKMVTVRGRENPDTMNENRQCVNKRHCVEKTKGC